MAARRGEEGDDAREAADATRRPDRTERSENHDPSGYCRVELFSSGGDGCGPRALRDPGRARRSALRRGFLVAIPVGLALLLELGLDSPTRGRSAFALCSPAFRTSDAPARTNRLAGSGCTGDRAGGRLGVLTGANAFTAIWRWLWSAPRPTTLLRLPALLDRGLSAALSLLICQDLPLDFGDVVPALLWQRRGCCGCLLLCVWAAGDRDGRAGGRASGALEALRST